MPGRCHPKWLMITGSSHGAAQRRGGRGCVMRPSPAPAQPECGREDSPDEHRGGTLLSSWLSPSREPRSWSPGKSGEPHGSWGDERSRVLLSPLLPALLAWPRAGRASSALKRTPCLGPAGADTGARVSNGLPSGAHGAPRVLDGTFAVAPSAHRSSDGPEA